MKNEKDVTNKEGTNVMVRSEQRVLSPVYRVIEALICRWSLSRR